MVWAQVLAIIFSVLFVVGLIIYNIVNSAKEKQLKGVRKNPPRLKLLGRTAFTNGYFEGFLTKDLPRKNGCHLLEFYPTDVEEQEGKKRPTIQSVVVKDTYLKHMPRGTLSGETEQIWAIPPDKMDLPQNMRDTWLGKKIEEESENAFVEKTFGNRRKKTLQVASRLIEDTTEISLTEQELARLKEKIREMEKLVGSQPQPKEEEKKS